MLTLTLVMNACLASNDFNHPYLTELANAYEDLVETDVSDQELHRLDVVYAVYSSQIIEHQHKLFNQSEI
jgi:hypothetical protein